MAQTKHRDQTPEEHARALDASDPFPVRPPDHPAGEVRPGQYAGKDAERMTPRAVRTEVEQGEVFGEDAMSAGGTGGLKGS